MISVNLGGIVFNGGDRVMEDDQHGWYFTEFEDWLSLTSTKADITERPYAHGAFDPGTDWRSSGVYTLTAYYYAHSVSELETSIRDLTRLGGIDSLIECAVTVDGDTTRRMVEIVSINVPSHHMRTKLGGITIDLRAPDPLAYGDTSSASTGLPKAGGGIVFDTSPSTRWTGTPNASTSTLSQDGQVVATNLVTSPKPYTKDFYSLTNCTVTDDNGWVRITPDSGNTSPQQGWAYLHLDKSTVAKGDNLVLAFECRSDSPNDYRVAFINCASSVAREASVHANPGSAGLLVSKQFTYGEYYGNDFTFQTFGQYSLWVRNVVVCTAADWSAMQALGIDWFDGDTYPGHLLFPIDFGAPGDEGRVSFVNSGTASTSVRMSVSGGFADGFQLKRVETGQLLTMRRLVAESDTVVLDSSDGSAMLNGLSSVSGYLTDDDWWNVNAGEKCTIQFTALGEVTGTPKLSLSASPAFF